LFLDDVDAFVSGHYQELFFRNSDLIKSAINDARLLAVASMTTNVYHEQVVSSEWFRKRFNAIEVKPLQFVDSRDAIRQNLPRIVSHYGIAFDFSAVDEIVLLASRHNHWGCLPGSAFRLLDEIASQIIVNNVEKKNFEELDMAIKNFQQIKEDAVENQDFEKAAGIRDEVDTIRKIKESIMKLMQTMKATEEVSVDYDLVASEYRNVTGLPNLWSLWGKDRGNSLTTIRVELSNVIKGQEAAVEAVLRVVPHLVSGSQQFGRPFSSLLFAGPSGTGKTLLCELLAKHLLGDVKPIVIDLTAYSREEDVPRLYAKMNELLCNEELIRGLALPRGILVFDHLESAAQEVKTIISSWFRDNWYGAGYDWGKSIGCCLVILMTRGGISEPLWRSTEPLRELEFERSRVAIRDTITKNIETAFPADLINRLDSIVVFDSFLRCDLLAIFDLLIDDWRACLQEEGISVLIDENARERIISMSQVPALGARMLGWNVEHFFMRPAAEKVTMSAMASRRRIRIEAREQVFNHLFEISVESANVS
jgi:ATP-dependent Clp protease ATP-binding subunit ClpC